MAIQQTEMPSSPPEREQRSWARAGRWIHVVPHLDPAFGGLSAVVPELVSALNTEDLCTAEIAAFCTAEEALPASSEGVRVTRWPLNRMPWLRHSSLRAALRQQLSTADGLHIHGLWEQSTLLAAHMARDLGKPYILSAHGMLDPWALRNKRTKKRLYAAVLERRNVAGAACLHALTESEAQNYRDFLGDTPHPPIMVVPNGVTVPAKPDPEPFFSMFPDLRGRRLLLFLGRIHFKKGVDVLVRAWATLADRFPEAHLVLAGPDFEGTRAETERLVSELRIGSRVTFTGMLRGELKWAALAAAGVFVLPSLSEGFSVSVLEAMGTGLPVIVTPDCHVPQVFDTSAGWITQSQVEPLAFTLRDFLSRQIETGRQMGARGRDLVVRSFSWSAIAQGMAEAYAEIESCSRVAKSMDLDIKRMHENR